MQTLKASHEPLSDIELIAYKGQSAERKQYRFGYEQFFNQMPLLTTSDPLLEKKIQFSASTMQVLGKDLQGAQWLKRSDPGKGRFSRHILAIQSPKVAINGNIKPGPEFVVAHWGDGFTTPVHGHAPGLIHEELISGIMRVNTYRRIGKTRIARPIRTEIKYPGTIVSKYEQPDFDNLSDRSSLIHNFTAIGFGNTLHFLPEYTRDGRDNTFEVEYFDDVFDLTDHVERIASRDGMYLQIGDVVLVRSENVPEYGDHYIVITGHPIVKEHGLRPQDVAIAAPKNKLLGKYPTETGLTLLKLNETAKKAFLEFHDIIVDGKTVSFPNP